MHEVYVNPHTTTTDRARIAAELDDYEHMICRLDTFRQLYPSLTQAAEAKCRAQIKSDCGSMAPSTEAQLGADIERVAQAVADEEEAAATSMALRVRDRGGLGGSNEVRTLDCSLLPC